MNQNKNSINFSIFDYVLVYVSYAMGGIMFFYLKPLPKLIFVLVLLAYALYKKIKIELSFIVMLGIFTLLYLLQSYKFQAGDIRNFGGNITIFTIGYLLYKVYGAKYMLLFTRIVYFFCYISLLFWLLQQYLPIYNFMQSLTVILEKTDPSIMNESFIITGLERYRQYWGFYRNNGGFWEPGAYAVSLILALIYHILLNRNNRRERNILIITLLTTLSTAGYIALFFLSFVLFKKSRNRAILQIFGLVIISVSFVSLDFMLPKLRDQYTSAKEQNLDEATSGRIFGARKSLYGISQNPLTGKYLVKERSVELDDLAYEKDLGWYGLLFMFQKLGIVVSLLFMLWLYYGIKKLYKTTVNNRYHNYLYLAWIAVMLSQSLYWIPASLFLFYANNSSYKKLESSVKLTR